MAKEIKGFKAEEQEGLQLALAEIETGLGTKMADTVKTQIEAAMANTTKEVSELKQYKVEAEAAAKLNQDALDKLLAEKGKTVINVAHGSNLGSEMSKAFEEGKDKLAAYGSKENSRRAIQFELKAVGNIGSGNFTVSGTHGFVNPTEFSAPGRKPYEMAHIRDLVSSAPLGPTTDVYVIRDAGGEGGPTSVVAGAAKPQSDRDWVKTIVPITKIAHYYKIPEEYLADIVWLQSEITGVGIEELLAVEDQKFLTNTTANEFKGLNQTFNSTAFAAPASLANTVVAANNYDVLVAAWTQLIGLNNRTTDVLVNLYGEIIRKSTGLYDLNRQPV